jgi:hypothetical protein
VKCGRGRHWHSAARAGRLEGLREAASMGDTREGARKPGRLARAVTLLSMTRQLTNIETNKIKLILKQLENGNVEKAVEEVKMICQMVECLRSCKNLT